MGLGLFGAAGPLDSSSCSCWLGFSADTSVDGFVPSSESSLEGILATGVGLFTEGSLFGAAGALGFFLTFSEDSVFCSLPAADSSIDDREGGLLTSGEVFFSTGMALGLLCSPLDLLLKGFGGGGRAAGPGGFEGGGPLLLLGATG